MQYHVDSDHVLLSNPSNDSVVYIIRECGSVDPHVNDWIPSRENKALPLLFKDDLIVDWVIRIDAPRLTLPFPKTAEEHHSSSSSSLSLSLSLSLLLSSESVS